MDSSTFAREVDQTFYFIYWISVFFFVLITVLMVYFVFRYRRKEEGEYGPGRSTHNTPLELTWSGIPLVLVIVMFYIGFKGFADVLNAPLNAMDVYVTGFKWGWAFTYPVSPTGQPVVTDELHLPVDTPVRLIMQSQDVIHSFYVPAFRIKRDAVPGRYNKIWFEATKPGEYLALCAEFCGTSHSNMLAKVVVHPSGDFEKWLVQAADITKGGTVPPADVGKQIVARRCASCHSIDGSANIGPSFKGIYNRQTPLEGAPAVVADENYIRESILYPQAKVHQGYNPVMPTFKGQLSDKEIFALIQYMRQLSDADVVPTWGTDPNAPAAAAPAAGAGDAKP